MKMRQGLQILTLILILVCIAPVPAQAEDESGRRTAGSPLQGKNTPREFYARDGLGYWFSDFRWVGFDDWPFDSNAEDPGRAFTYAPVVLLLRYPKWEIQPYVGMFPYFTMSGGGIDLRPGEPGVVVGVSLSF
jgi:hypothetical protein